MKKYIKLKFFDLNFFIQYLSICYILFAFITLFDKTYSIPFIFIDGTIFIIFTYPLSYFFRIILNQYRKKELTVNHILKQTFRWLVVFLILWPIFIFIIQAILMIIYLIFGFVSFIAFDLDITSGGTLGSKIFENILFPNGKISFWPLLPWRHLWVTTFLAIIMSSIGADYIYTKSRIKKRESVIPKKEESQTLYAKLKEYKSRIIPIKTKIETDSDKKRKEIKSFFESLQRKKKENILSYNGTILDDSNYNLFYSFINETKESLCILCWRVDERLLSELLWFLKDKNIKVQLITKNRTNKGYLKEFKKYCSNLKLENPTHRNKIHAKLIIKDNKYLVLGSSNFTEASMSETGNFLDCNIITKHKEIVESAIDLFKSLYQNKDYTKNSKLMYSRNHKDYLPFSLKPYFEKENEEIILLFSCNQVDKRIIDRIIEWNSKTLIKLYVSDRWTTSEINQDNLYSMKWLCGASSNAYRNVRVIPIRSNVHSKLYLFKGQKIAFISSQNLTVESWQSLLETGIITNDKKDLKYLLGSIKSFKKSKLDKIDDLEETDKPESSFSGSKYEAPIGLPWELPEADEKWKIPKSRIWKYYKLVKHKPKEKSEKLLESVGKREGSSKIIKNPLLEELGSKYLKNYSTTELYSKPTRFLLKGISRRKEMLFWENKLEYFNRLYKEASSDKERKRNRGAIDYIEKKLEEFD